MMIEKSPLSVIAIIIAILLLLTACQVPSLFKKEPEKQLSGKLSVVLTQSSNSLMYLNTHPIKDKLEKFMELHPNVKIDIQLIRSVETVSGKVVDYNIRYGGELAFPDIIELGPNQVILSLQDRLEDLSPFFSSEFHHSWEGGYRQLIDGASVNGRQFLLPVRSLTPMVFYDKALFREYGFLDPEQGWSWEQFVDIGRRLKQDGHSVMLPNYLPVVEPIIRGLGGSYSSTNLKLDGYLDSEFTIEAFRQLTETNLLEYDSMINKEGIHQLGITMLISEYISVRRHLIDAERYALAPMPLFTHGDNKLPSAISGLAISKDSANKELAWEVLKFVVGATDDEALDFAAYYTLFFNTDEFYKKPLPQDYLILERLKKDMPLAVPATFAMTTNMNMYGHYEGHIFYPTQIWVDLNRLVDGGDPGDILREMTTKLEGRIANLFVK